MLTADKQLNSLADDILAQIIPPESVGPETVDHWPGPAGSYTTTRHAKACQMKILGLSDRETAKIVGVKPKDIQTWREQWPKFDSDLRQAEAISVAFAASVLRKLMAGEGPAALNAIKFFLKTHAEEFRDDTEFTAKISYQETADIIRNIVYGIA